MAGPTRALLRQLADRNDWRSIAALLDTPDYRERLARITDQFTALGVASESAAKSSKDWIRAVHCYRIAVWSNALHIEAAPDYDERQRRWWLGADVRWKFQAAHRALLKRDPNPQPTAGEPITVDDHWREGFPALQDFAQRGEFAQAERLLLLLEALRDDDGDRGIANAGKLETIGDALADSHRDAACWFFRKASQRFSNWVSSSSSGGEGTARSAIRDSAAAKLARLAAR